MRIDAEQRWSAEHGIGDLWPILERNRFEGSVLFAPAEQSVVDAAREHAFIKAVVVETDSPEAAMERWGGDGLVRGVRCAVSDAVCSRLATVGWMLEAEGSDALLAAAVRFPEIRLVARIDVFDLDEQWWAVAERAGNVWMKPVLPLGSAGAAAASVRPFVQSCLRRLGPHRLLFASGWPESASWKERLAAFTQAIGPQPVAAREEMLGGAAARAYFSTLTSLK